MDHDKQIAAAEAAQAATLKATSDVASYMTVEERAAAERAKLYTTLKAHSALDVYYQMYPDERPKSEQAKLERVREDDGRER